jgi:hypothetical protein
MAEATSAVGFGLETPDPALLPGVDKTPRIQVMPGQEVRFTIEKARADAYLKSTGRTDISVPSTLDGATLVVSIPTAAVLEYGGTAGSKDALVIGQAGELVVDVEGGKVSLEEMRDWLLTVVPSDVARQLKDIKNWNDTLPIPVPIDKVNWTAASFQNNPGLLLNDNSGAGSAAIWHARGHLYGVAGSLKAVDLQKIADSLKVRN